MSYYNNKLLMNELIIVVLNNNNCYTCGEIKNTIRKVLLEKV